MTDQPLLRPMSSELRDDLIRILESRQACLNTGCTVGGPHGNYCTAVRERVALNMLDELAPILGSIDENAYRRGRRDALEELA